MPYICTVCGSPERDCQCPRFCTLCKSDDNIRLCEDGCYYCLDCREVCGFIPEEKEEP
jgi:sulfur transfer complex TusBCD TusB component (DsrH family)